MTIIETRKNKEKVNLFEYLHIVLIYTFAGIGALFVGVFFANRFNLTNTSGSVDILSNSFKENYATNFQVLGLETQKEKIDKVNFLEDLSQIESKKQQLISSICDLKTLTPLAPKNILKILEAKESGASPAVVNGMIFTIKSHLKKSEAQTEEVRSCISQGDNLDFSSEYLKNEASKLSAKNILVWPDLPEWTIIADAIKKDQEQIKKASEIAKIDSRLVVSSLVVEQLRLFYSQRELYKKFFEPLKILANANKFSLGVMSIKEETAKSTEEHLKDHTSPYYLGPDLENVLDYQTDTKIGAERYNRLTSSDHYYNYLYGALYLKQIIVQWQSAGYDISQRPEIIGTLFNLGFSQSKPNSEPSVGGSNISIGGTNYSFGRLASEFFYSGELTDIFPYSQTK